MTAKIIIGVDGGGTGCRAAVGTPTAGVLAETEAGPANVTTDFDQARDNIVAAVTQALQTAGLHPDALPNATAHIGVAGILGPTDCTRLSDALPFGNTTTSSDRLTAAIGALGETTGGLLSIGTGCIVAVKTHNDIRFNNGWGFVLSDQGSGAWLGRAALEQVLICHDGMQGFTPLTTALFGQFDNDPAQVVRFASRASPADFARHAPLVIAHGAEDPFAATLLQKGVDHLLQALHAIGFHAGDPICLTGGVGPHLAPYLPATVRTGLMESKGSALEGAYALALKAAAS